MKFFIIAQGAVEKIYEWFGLRQLTRCARTVDQRPRSTDREKQNKIQQQQPCSTSNIKEICKIIQHLTYQIFHPRSKFTKLRLNYQLFKTITNEPVCRRFLVARKTLNNSYKNRPKSRERKKFIW